jgi:phosphatidate phosphatase APP1
VGDAGLGGEDWSSMMSSGDAHGVISNVDSVLRLGSLRRLLGRLRSLRTTSLRDRRSMLAMPRLVRAISADLDGAPVFYLTAFPIVLARPITNMLLRDGYPYRGGRVLRPGSSRRVDPDRALRDG